MWQSILKMAESARTNYGPDAAIAMDCKQMTADFAKTECIHCFREAKGVADRIVKYSFDTRSSKIWGSTIPDFVSHFLAVNDLSTIWEIKF